MPRHVPFEGAGDCIFDPRRGLFWMGSGPRSHPAARDVVKDVFGAHCITLPLADACFYHLDTAFCPLPCGAVIYYPTAFTAAGLAAIHREVEPIDRIEIERADAERFAANSVCFERSVVLSGASAVLRRRLEERGCTLVVTPLDAFQRSGGSACCLTLRLDHRSRSSGASAGLLGRPAAAVSL
jgi:N-dimethylarginine dimethylaminohydrolase